MHQSVVVSEYITSGAPDYILFETLWSCDNPFTLVVLVPVPAILIDVSSVSNIL